jgi:hypothetical protein
VGIVDHAVQPGARQTGLKSLSEYFGKKALPRSTTGA